MTITMALMGTMLTDGCRCIDLQHVPTINDRGRLVMVGADMTGLEVKCMGLNGKP